MRETSLDSRVPPAMDELLLAGILLCLPPKSIYRFRVVSKTWNSLISDPFFIERYDSKRRRRHEGGGLLALFQNTIVWPYSSQPDRYDQKSLKILPLDANSKIKNQSPELGQFINSSNGLILCSGARNHREFLVVNPVTGRFVTLPPPPPLPAEDEYALMESPVGLMCEENKAELTAKYIVIRNESSPDEEAFKIRTYSSETGAWAAEPKVIAADTAGLELHLKAFPCPPFVMNGVFHWYTIFKEKLVLYRPAEEHLQLISNPAWFDGMLWNPLCFTTIARTSIEDGDVLWFGFMDPETMRLFMLTKGTEESRGNDNQPRPSRPSIVAGQEWVLMYRISLSSLWNDRLLYPLKWQNPWVRIIFLDAFVPINDNKSKKKKKNTAPFDLILRVQEGDAFLFHLNTKSIQPLVKYEACPTSGAYAVHSLALHPYLEPSSLSTYAL
ncbi:unnamed protein product [Cuscuta europaea]|uniref:F-box domain-containing protein n=1 Tax=Cuscuta europaea TaxID=41803 RepID=A0A9P1EMV0_CUSEU|nr:unnamed protein product [Cuscuta europaea]